MSSAAIRSPGPLPISKTALPGETRNRRTGLDALVIAAVPASPRVGLVGELTDPPHEVVVRRWQFVHHTAGRYPRAPTPRAASAGACGQCLAVPRGLASPLTGKQRLAEQRVDERLT